MSIKDIYFTNFGYENGVSIHIYCEDETVIDILFRQKTVDEIANSLNIIIRGITFGFKSLKDFSYRTTKEMFNLINKKTLASRKTIRDLFCEKGIVINVKDINNE